MVFKRYIRKHGKKLGPYYYENVRSDDGKVKTIYVGTNPHNHPKHRIKKPLVFLIIALLLILILGGSLFFMQNKAYLIKKANLQEPNFEIDQILLKVLIRSSESLEKQLRVMNTGNWPTTLNVEASGLLDILKIDSTSFTLKPGQTKIVALNFSSFLAEQKIEQQPGIYVGKLSVASEKVAEEIPVVVEIETKNVLFDMNLNPVAIERKVKQGTDTTIEVRLFNLESIESVNVDVEYFVKDMNGNTIMTESETVVVKTQASFFKTISIPKNLKPGPYVFAAQAKFGSSIGTSSYLFEVVGPEPEPSFVQFCKNNVPCLGLSLTTMLLLFALTAYFYFFIGAYLYERVTGAGLPKKRKEKITEITEEAKPSIFDKIKNKLKEWKEKRLEAKAEKELMQPLEKKEPKPSSLLKKFYKIIGEAKDAIGNNDSLKTDKLYSKARDLYVDLEEHEKRKVYSSLMELYKQRNLLLKEKKYEEKLKLREEESKKQKELEAKKGTEEEKKRILAQKAMSRQERREKIRGLFHKLGLYRTPEEKKRIALQREKDRRQKEKIKLEEIKRKQKEENRLRKQKELEQRQKEKQKLAEERKAQLEAQKRQLEEERKKQEELKRQEILGTQKELQRQAYEQEKRRQELEEKQRKEGDLVRQREKEQRKEQEELRRQEALRQKELERRQAEEEKRELEEAKNKQKEEEKRQKEIESQKQEQIKAQKLELIRQLESEISKNRQNASLLNSQLRNLDSEKRLLAAKSTGSDAGVKKIDNQILGISKNIDNLNAQKQSLSQKYQKQLDELSKEEAEEKAAISAREKESRSNFTAKQDSLAKELEDELSKLTPSQRKKTEKWKRMELKARLKLEEHKLEEELKKYSGKTASKKAEIEGNYKNGLEELSKKQDGLKQAVAGLEGQKQQLILEKGNVPKDLLGKENEIQRIRAKLEDLLSEQKRLSAELSKLKPRMHFGLFSNLISGFKEMAQKKAEARRQKLEKRELWKQEHEEQKAVAIRRKLTEEAEKEEKPSQVKPKPEKIEKKRPKTESEELKELEETIRGLSLFKKVEEGKVSITEAIKKKPSVIGRLFKKEKKPVEESAKTEKPEPVYEPKEKAPEEVQGKPSGFFSAIREKINKWKEARQADIQQETETKYLPEPEPKPFEGKISKGKGLESFDELMKGLERKKAKEKISAKKEPSLLKKSKPRKTKFFRSRKFQQDFLGIKKQKKEKISGSMKSKPPKKIKEPKSEKDLFKRLEAKPKKQAAKKQIELPKTLEEHEISHFEARQKPKEEKPKEVLESEGEIKSAIGKLRQHEKPSLLKGLFAKKAKARQPEAAQPSTIDSLSLIHSHINDARQSLMKFDLEAAKRNYIEAVKLYKNLSHEDQAKVYNDIRDLYLERKSAEELKV